jgi:hypothetical protein
MVKHGRGVVSCPLRPRAGEPPRLDHWGRPPNAFRAPVSPLKTPGCGSPWQWGRQGKRLPTRRQVGPLHLDKVTMMPMLSWSWQVLHETYPGSTLPPNRFRGGSPSRRGGSGSPYRRNGNGVGRGARHSRRGRHGGVDDDEDEYGVPSVEFPKPKSKAHNDVTTR